jgi:natural product precursor
MKLEKIKLRDIVNEQLTNEELELLKGGFYSSGCSNNICSAGSEISKNTIYCTNGDGVCNHWLSTG